MNTRGQKEALDQMKMTPEEIHRYTVLLFTEVPENVDIRSVLALIKGVDVLSAVRDGTFIYISFFSYFDLFQQWSTLEHEVNLNSIKIPVYPVKSSLSDEMREKLYMSHAAGGTRNIMLSSLDDFMTGEFIKEEAEKYGSVESLKHLKDRKIAYIEFFSFSAAMEFVISLREDTLFQNVKVCFGKDKCGSGESDDVAVLNKRTVYFGNIPADVLPSEILAIVQGGQVYTVKVIKDKKCAFVRFFDYISAASFIEYSQVFPIYIRGVPIKLGPGKVQPFPHIAPILAYKGVTRSILLRVDKSINQAKLEPELSRYGEIDKIEKNNGDLVKISYLNAQDSHAAYEALKNDSSASHMLCGYTADPCEEISSFGLMMEIQRKEYML